MTFDRETAKAYIPEEELTLSRERLINSFFDAAVCADAPSKKVTPTHKTSTPKTAREANLTESPAWVEELQKKMNFPLDTKGFFKYYSYCSQRRNYKIHHF